MPFTISHTAIVLPFSRSLARWQLLSATIIGSMVPDFGLLMPWRPPRVETHSATGLLTFCLPVGLATFWVFQQLLKTPLMAVVPDAAYARWLKFAAPADIRNGRQWLLAAAGVFVGAVTHLIWDAFTHEGARGVRMIPLLVEPVIDIAGHRLIGARLLQDVSSLVGLIVVLGILGYGLRRGRAAPAPPMRALHPGERHLWIIAYASTAVLLAGLFLIIRRPTEASAHSPAILLANVAIAMLRGFAAALLIVSLCVTARLRAVS